ncbi:MAG: hypothetical protein ISN29_05080 [Gammaproteobacteria bacterium AqS3]|nr:hypothetical protein [Gammaproteobacteria bacterium AqS3]
MYIKSILDLLSKNITGELIEYLYRLDGVEAVVYQLSNKKWSKNEASLQCVFERPFEETEELFEVSKICKQWKESHEIENISVNVGFPEIPSLRTVEVILKVRFPNSDYGDAIDALAGDDTDRIRIPNETYMQTIREKIQGAEQA